MSQFYLYDCNYNHDHCCRKSLRRSVHLLYHQQPTVKSTARHPCRQRSLFCGLVPVCTVHLVCQHTIRQCRVDRVRSTVQWDSLWRLSRLSLRFNNCHCESNLNGKLQALERKGHVSWKEWYSWYEPTIRTNQPPQHYITVCLIKASGKQKICCSHYTPRYWVALRCAKLKILPSVSSFMLYVTGKLTN